VGPALHKEGITSVSDVSLYIHALNGRIRIKVIQLKGSPQRALEVEEQLRGVEGVRFVKANPTTGSVLIRYDPDQIEQQVVLGALQSLDCLRGGEVVWTGARNRSQVLDGLGGSLAETLVRTTMELAVQRLVSALL
jgi:copper chaperone CopZ